MRKSTWLLWLMASLTLSAYAGTPVKVVLAGGQSNMLGAASSAQLPASLQAPQPDVLFYNGNTGSPTLQTLRPWGDGTFGPEITFGRKMEDDHPADLYAIIKYAVGGTTLAVDWKPTAPVGPAYTAFKNAVASGIQALVNAGYDPQIIGMLWLQGEGDATTLTYANAYQSNLTNLISDVRTNYGPSLPFIIGGIGDNGQYRATVNTAFTNAAASIANVRYFSNDDINPNLQLHFDAAQQQTIGQRFASKLESIPEPAILAWVMIGVPVALRPRRSVVR